MLLAIFEVSEASCHPSDALKSIKKKKTFIQLLQEGSLQFFPKSYHVAFVLDHIYPEEAIIIIKKKTALF